MGELPFQVSHDAPTKPILPKSDHPTITENPGVIPTIGRYYQVERSGGTVQDGCLCYSATSRPGGSEVYTMFFLDHGQESPNGDKISVPTIKVTTSKKISEDDSQPDNRMKKRRALVPDTSDCAFDQGLFGDFAFYIQDKEIRESGKINRQGTLRYGRIREIRGTDVWFYGSDKPHNALAVMQLQDEMMLHTRLINRGYQEKEPTPQIEGVQVFMTNEYGEDDVYAVTTRDINGNVRLEPATVRKDEKIRANILVPRHAIPTLKKT